ncbi:ISAs1 family transposase [Saccharopolyspora hattusasensis]|uniref:ISAs1 family transposase n=1 Tax=Saccharopolyspora hattusasensis TaxID=1128679 RepID=UPI003D96326C
MTSWLVWPARIAGGHWIRRFRNRRWWQGFSQVPDRRKRRGRRHDLVAVLVLAACATLVVGTDSVTAIWQWAAGTSQEVLARIGARRDPLRGRYLVPSERTFRRVLAGLDGEAFDAATCGYAVDVVRGRAPVPVVSRTPGPVEREERRAAQREREHPAPPGLLPGAAVDGKALRGSVTATGTRTFLLGVISHVTGVVLGQQQVPDKKGEGGQLEKLLAPLDAAGMVFTLDALHITKKTARLITQDLGAHYVLILKGNQPSALKAARTALAGLDTDWAASSTVENDCGHGRTERRGIRTATTDDTLFPGARQVFRIRRDVGGLDNIWTSKEIIHGVTSLPAGLARPEHLNHYQRQHWTVENRLHWTRDVTFHEDSSQLGTGTAPRALAGLRNLAISTFRLAGRANIAHARRDLHNHNDAFTVFGI